MMDPRDVIVAGGAGFLGSHLVDRLIEAGHRIRVLDNFSTGSPDNSPTCMAIVASR